MLRLLTAVLALALAAPAGAQSPVTNLNGATNPSGMPVAPTGHIAWPVGRPVWEFDFYRPANRTTSQGTGLELRNVTYLGRKVFERASVPVLNVVYAAGGGCGCYRDWQYEESPVLSTPAAGGVTTDFYTDAVPGSVVSTCERSTNGPAEDAGTFVGVAVEDYGTELVLTGHMRAGWYRYRVKWHFYADGRIWPEYSFASATNACTASPRQHHAYWRFDFDLENTPGDDVVTEIASSGAATVLATEAARTWTADRGTRWSVTDGATGAGFTVEPGPLDTDPRVAADADSKFDALVVRYKRAEIDDGLTINTGCQFAFEPWLNGESVSGFDSVFWYRSSSARTTGTCELRGPTLRPFGYTTTALGGAPGEASVAAVEVQAATPNPFSRGTSVRFRVAAAQDLRVTLYDALGRRVRTLFEGPLDAGVYETVEVLGADLPPGTYVVRVEGALAAGSTRIVLAR